MDKKIVIPMISLLDEVSGWEISRKKKSPLLQGISVGQKTFTELTIKEIGKRRQPIVKRKRGTKGS